MQRHSNAEAVMPSVRLFPRLVTTNPATVVATSSKGDRAQVRARLLRMILDSERNRRGGRRPTAG